MEDSFPGWLVGRARVSSPTTDLSKQVPYLEPLAKVGRAIAESSILGEAQSPPPPPADALAKLGLRSRDEGGGAAEPVASRRGERHGVNEMKPTREERVILRMLAAQARRKGQHIDPKAELEKLRQRGADAPPPPPPAPPPPARRPPASAAAPPPAPGKKHSGPAPVVAVFDIEDRHKTLKPAEANDLTDYLIVQMSVAGYKTVPRNELKSRLTQTKKDSFKACYDEGCQIDLGKAVAAEKSLATKLLKVGSKCALTGTLYDLRTETTERAASVATDCNSDSLFEGTEKLAQQLKH